MKPTLKRLVKSRADSPELKAIDLKLSEARLRWMAADTFSQKARVMREIDSLLDERFVHQPK